MNIKYNSILILAAIALAGGCANHDEFTASESMGDGQSFKAPNSYLNSQRSGLSTAQDGLLPNISADKLTESSPKNTEGVTSLKSLDWVTKNKILASSLRDKLSKDKDLTVVAEKMPLGDFIHYIFGKLLDVNYILGVSVNSGDTGDQVTLSINEPLSERNVFDLSSELLAERGLRIKLSKNSYFIYRDDTPNAESQVVIGMGRKASEVPQTNQSIMQVIPIKFGIKGALERTLRSLSGAKIVPDFEQSAIFAEGSRREILKAIELIDLLDTPANRGRHIGLVELTYMLPDQFVKEVKVLLGNEGISSAIGQANGMNLVLVPFDQLGATIVFATNEFFLDRVRYWASVLDAPLEGDAKQYFIYKPKYSRAQDLSKSIGTLIGSESTAVRSDEASTGQAPSTARSFSGIDVGIDMVIDERANALIFYSSGIDYRALLPLIKALDVLPKQVMLDIVIAEVSLKDEFKYGVEWALKNSEVTLTTQGAFGATSIGGMGLIIDGVKGPLQANFLGANSLIKVLSNPSLMVRDGTNASISIGSEISVVGQTTQDPINGDRQTSSAEYRSTGVDVQVDVAINSSGIVLMNITQAISNQIPGSAGAGGNPDIFTRNLRTEVLARSGQTVMLGGLISENKASGSSGTPVLSKIPLLGSLFKSESESADRTELVMLVTPRVIENLESWDDLLLDFSETLRHLKFESTSQ